nr:PREDICTED: semaphorin-7A [Anolis carolinensis]|eukprot:XP_016854671.1 PREDICTED: semaphorin-7A [Anolis carolinensis]
MFHEAGSNQVLIGGQGALWLLTFTGSAVIQKKIPLKADEKAEKDCKKRATLGEDDCENTIRLIKKLDYRIMVCGTNAGSPKCWFLVNQTLQQDKEGHVVTLSADNIVPPLLSQEAVAVAIEGNLYSAVSGKKGMIQRSYGTKKGIKTEDSWLAKSEFVGAALLPEDDQRKDEIFFFYNDVNESAGLDKEPYRAHLGRVCKVDQGGKPILTDSWSTFLKARLVCGHPNEPMRFHRLRGAFVFRKEEKGEAVLYGVFSSTWGSSAVCSYSMKRVSSLFKTSGFKGFSGSLPNPRPGTVEYTFFSKVNNANNIIVIIVINTVCCTPGLEIPMTTAPHKSRAHHFVQQESSQSSLNHQFNHQPLVTDLQHCFPICLLNLCLFPFSLLQCVPPESTHLLPSRTLSFIKEHPELDVVIYPDEERPLYVLQNNDTYTHVVVDQVRDASNVSYDVLYLGTAKGKIHKVLRSKDQTVIIAEISPFKEQEPISSMILDASTSHLFADTKAEVTRLPLADCDPYSENCWKCVLARDPYCGWDMDGRKCSAVSQDESHTGRLLQSLDSTNTTYVCEAAEAKLAQEALKKVSVDPTSYIYLPCPLRSHHAIYTWVKDDKTYPCAMDEQSCTLRFGESTPMDQGVFKCTAKEEGFQEEITAFKVTLNAGRVSEVSLIAVGAGIVFLTITILLL